MKIFESTGKIDDKGYLKVEIPTDLSPGTVNFVLVVDQEEKPISRQPYDFSEFAGKLKWEGDALTEQKKLRDEWG
jgi:hypothetical protein